VGLLKRETFLTPALAMPSEEEYSVSIVSIIVQGDLLLLDCYNILYQAILIGAVNFSTFVTEHTPVDISSILGK
jgi:hypothetical protein